MLAVIKHAPAHGACKTVQQLLCKSLNFISPELWPQHARIELNWLQDLGSLSKISAKNYQNWLMFVKVIASQSSDVFWDTTYK